MPMTIVVTRNVPDRFRGFLASCMCEIAPGVYTAPRMTRSVRDRVWGVMQEWWQDVEEQAVLMTWPDPKRTGGQQVRALGLPRQDLEDHHGVFLARREIDEATVARLEESLEKGRVRPRPQRVEDLDESEDGEPAPDDEADEPED